MVSLGLIRMMEQHCFSANAKDFDYLEKTPHRIERVIQRVAAMHDVEGVGFNERRQVFREAYPGPKLRGQFISFDERDIGARKRIDTSQANFSTIKSCSKYSQWPRADIEDF